MSSKQKYLRSLHIFRRDLRIKDNTGLNKALEECTEVATCFIFDPRQVGEKNEYRSSNAIQFMINSLKSLDDALKEKNGKLYLFYGKTEDIVKKIIDTLSLDAIYCNYDYTPFSKKRDAAINDICKKHDISFIQCHDALINNPDDIKTTSGTPYAVFTPFYKASRPKGVDKPIPNVAENFYTKTISFAETTDVYNKILKEKNNDILVKGGRQEALSILRNLAAFENYKEDRDYPSIATTRLSAHNKFGTISIREFYYAIKEKLSQRHELIRQLYWRDFFYHVAYHTPSVFGHAYQEKYENLTWSTDKEQFKAWCQGKTGFPIVDAGMRQLNTIGWMHNRARMIVSSFLTKDLHINWLWGEKYFAQRLVDYDPCVNNGSWQWAASTGCDAQPYFRIFNPWLQQKKYDPDCIYIKKWVPELQHVDNSIIHNWYKSNETIPKYPKPIVDHDKERKIALKKFKNV